jgi:hypothetical protein
MLCGNEISIKRACTSFCMALKMNSSEDGLVEEWKLVT